MRSKSSRDPLAFGEVRLPDFLLVGAQKAGTTSLMTWLSTHPDIFAPVEEIHFFNDHFELGTEWYADHFRGARNAKVVGEGTPQYMYTAVTRQRIASLIPRAKILVLLRDPVDRAYSHYWHNRSRGRERLSFEDAVGREMQSSSDETQPIHPHFAYLGRGLYLSQLEGFTEWFPESAIKVLLFDDLQADPVAMFEDVCRFLGIDPIDIPDQGDRVRNPYVAYRSKLLRPLARQLPWPIGPAIGKLNVRSTDRYPPMSREIGVHLRAHFREPNARLGAWIRRDLGHWSVEGTPSP